MNCNSTKPGIYDDVVADCLNYKVPPGISQKSYISNSYEETKSLHLFMFSDG